MTTRPSVRLADHLEIFTLLHGAMRRDAQRLVDALDRVPSLDRRAARRLGRWYDAFKEALGHHHRLEDDYFWPALRGRAPGFAEVESTMHAEHAELEAVLEEVARRLSHLGRATDDGWAGAYASGQACVARFHDTLFRHLADEEATALTLMGTHLTPGEFAQVDKRAQRAAGLGYVAFALPWLLDGMTPDQAARLLDQAPAPFRWLLRLVWMPRYRRLAAPLRGRR